MPLPLAKKIILAAVAACCVPTVQADPAPFRAAMEVLETRSQAEGCNLLLACARTGDADCQGEVARCLRDGDGLPRDLPESLAWARKSAERNSPAGLRELAVLNYYYAKDGERDPARILALAQKAVDLGDAKAFGVLGTLYREGVGVAKDAAKALAMFRQGAEQGDSYSQRSLGDMLAKGRGTRRDQAQADEWYRKALAAYRQAAALGSSRGQHNVGYMLEIGMGTAKDEKEAAVWYRKAAEQGYADAQNNLAIMYAQGQGLPKDDEEAVKWYRKAAEQDDADAQSALAFHYLHGRGVAKSEAQAAAWFRRAAELGDAPSQRYLGNLYAEGRGVARNEKEAAAWYQKAAAQGDLKARLALNNLVFPETIRLAHSAKPFNRLDLRCREDGDSQAVCVAVSHAVESPRGDESRAARESLKKSALLHEEVNNLHKTLLAASEPQQCETLLASMGPDVEAAASGLLPPAARGRLNKWKAACGAGDMEAFRKTVKALYPSPAALRADMEPLMKALLNISDRTCSFTVDTWNLKLQRIGDDQWQAKVIDKVPSNGIQGIERLLSRNPASREWTYEVRSLPSEGAPAGAGKTTEKYLPPSRDAEFAALGCKYVIH